MKIFLYICTLFCGLVFIYNQAYAQSQMSVVQEASEGEPVVVYGSANEGNHKRNTFVLEQKGEENPLGSPLYDVPSLNNNIITSPEESSENKSLIEYSPRVVSETLPQNPKISASESPQIVNKQIQNTLYESGDRIYDIQSYPIGDVDYIGEKNINPTITTYPAY